MSIRKRFLFALEDDQTVLDTEAGNPAEAELELVEDEAEMSEEATAVEDYAETLDSSVDDINEMESVNEVLEKTVDEGEGATEETAEIAEVAIENICKRLNLKNTSRMSLEAFGSKNTRLAATRISVESIGEKIAAAWKAVRAFFVRMWEKIKAFFKKIWGGIVNFKNKIRDMKNNWKKQRAANKELKAKYTVNGKLDKEAYKTALAEGKAAAKEALEKSKEAAAIITELQTAATKGDSAAVEVIISSSGLSVSTESRSVKRSKEDFDQQADTVLEAAKESAKEENEISGNEAVSTVETLLDATESSINNTPTQAEADKALDAVDVSVKQITEQAEKESEKLSKEAEAGGEAAAEAKEKLSLWSKVKTFVSKLFSSISSMVIGVFKRVYALIVFGIKFVAKMAAAIGLVILAAGAVVAGGTIEAGKGVYNAAVHGKA